MVETSSSLHNSAVNKRYEAKPEHKVGGTNRRNCTRTRTMADGNSERESTMSYIDPEYRSLLLSLLKENERNDQRRNESVKKRMRDKNLERGFAGTSHDDVLPDRENCGINDQGKRERETVVNVDVNGYGSDADADPELQNVLACLKEYGNAYAIEDGDSGLVIYEGECSSDDVSDRSSPREMRTNHEQHINVNSADENPRVDLVVESVNKGQKGVLRKRKIDGLAYEDNVDGAAAQKNSTEVLNRKRNQRNFSKDECSSDDVSDRSSPREMRTNHEQHINVNSADENPRVDLVVESVNKGQKGVLRKRKIDGLAYEDTVDGAAAQKNSTEVLNRKRNQRNFSKDECSSDDVSDRSSPREMRTNHEQHINVNSADENPRVDLVVENVNKGQKGVLRKRKIDGLAYEDTVDGVAAQKKSTEVLNQNRIELTSRKPYVEKNQRNFSKEKNVVQREVEEEDSSDDSDEDSDDDDYDGDDSGDEDSDDDDYDGDDSEDDYEDAYDYDDGCDDDYNYHQDADKEYPLERNLGKKLKGKNVVREDGRVKKKDVVQQSKKYLNRISPIHLVMEDEKPSLGKSYKIPSLGKSNKKDKGKSVVSDVNEAKAKKYKWFKQDNRGSIGPSRPYKEKVVQSGSLLKKNVKGKNVVSDVNEAKAKKNKWFKQDNRGSIGPSRPYKEKVVQSGSLLKKNVKPEKILKIAVAERESDTDSDEVEILDSSDAIKEGGCFVPSKNTDQDGACGPNGCADYRQRVLHILNEPYDTKEYSKCAEDVKVYLKNYPDLQRKLAKNKYWKGKRLPILRGFFFWLQNSPHDGAFKPWKDRECLSVKLKTSKGRR